MKQARLAFKAAHGRRSPPRAAIDDHDGSPVTITVVQWPFFGRDTWSPTRSRRVPWVSVVCVEPMTTPLWLVLLPITMNGRMSFPFIFWGRIRQRVGEIFDSKILIVSHVESCCSHHGVGIRISSLMSKIKLIFRVPIFLWPSQGLRFTRWLINKYINQDAF